MKSWKIKITDNNGNKVSYKQAIIRFNSSILYFLIIGLALLIYFKYGAINYFLIAFSTIIILLPLIRKDNKFLHDIISKTILVRN